MIKPVNGKLVLLLSGFILIMLSCTPESCQEETESFLKASFYSTSGKVQTPDSITIYGINMGTNKIYDKALKLQRVILPLNAAVAKSTFIVRINGITDTVTFRYTSYPHLISMECGITVYHNIYADSITFTKHAIDTIHTRKTIVTTINEENIRILY